MPLKLPFGNGAVMSRWHNEKTMFISLTLALFRKFQISGSVDVLCKRSTSISGPRQRCNYIFWWSNSAFCFVVKELILENSRQLYLFFSPFRNEANSLRKPQKKTS